MDLIIKLVAFLLIAQVPWAAAAELWGEGGSPYAWVIIIIVLIVVGLLTLLLVELVVVYKIVTLGGVPWRSVWLGQLLLLAIFLSYLTLIAFLFQPTTLTCCTLRFAVGFCYALTQAVLLVKILIVLSPKTQSGFLKLGHQLLILLLVVAVQVIVNVQWIVLRPSSVVNEHGATKCAPVYFPQLFYDYLASFVYICVVGVVLVVLTVMAYVRNRKANGKPNSEAKWILITCCVTAAAWMVWIMVGALLEGGDMAALALGLWVTATTTLLIMFVPKLHKLATLKEGEFYYEDALPGLVGYDQHGDGMELDTAEQMSVMGPPSIHSENVIYPASETDGRFLTTLERPPSVILEEKSNMSVSSAGPSPSVIYKTNDSENVHFSTDRHALELQHPTARSAYHSKYSTLSQDGRYSDYGPPPQSYYTLGGHGRHGPSSVIGAPRYERRYILASPLHHSPHTLQPHYVREVLPSPHHHHHSSAAASPRSVSGYPRYGSSSDLHRYVGSSSGSGLDSPHYRTTRASSVIGAPRYEGAAARRHLNGYSNPAFITSNGTLHHPPAQYVEVAPRKAASVIGVPSYKPQVIRPFEGEHTLSGSRRTLSQQDLRGGLTHVPSPQANLVTGTLPRSTRLVYKPISNGRLQPVEQRQRAFSDDILERSSVY